jgi:hypothetical protein
MYKKPTWAFKYCAIFFLTLAALAADGKKQSANADEMGKVAQRIVQQYGETTGGEESIGSLIEVHMSQWKPQSNLGIEVIGWDAEKVGPSIYIVTYGYEELGREKIFLSWRVDLADSSVIPLTPLSARIFEMASML